MAIKTRTLVLTFVVLILLLLNVARWWPGVDATVLPSVTGTSSHPYIDPQSLALVYQPSRLPASNVYRDLFAIEVVRPPKPINMPKPKVDLASSLAGKLPKSKVLPYRMMGVVTRGKALQAFILSGDITHVVRVGDTLDTQYRIKEIKNDSVSLQNITTNEQSQIKLVGP